MSTYETFRRGDRVIITKDVIKKLGINKKSPLSRIGKVVGFVPGAKPNQKLPVIRFPNSRAYSFPSNVLKRV